VTANLWHSCSRHRLSEHFKGRDPAVRATFDRYLKRARECGPVTVIPQKTRISFQARVRFGGAVTRKRWLEGGLWLRRRADHRRLIRVLSVTPRDHVHYFRLEDPRDIDAESTAFIHEAYAVGQQRHRSD
jgi:hypothetical protein